MHVRKPGRTQSAKSSARFPVSGSSSKARRRADDRRQVGENFMSYPITHIDGLDEDDVGALKAVGIRTTERLLEQAKSPKGRKLLAGRTGIGEKRLLDFANAADHMRIKGMGKGYVGLLRAVGVMT